ncbi:MAG: HAD family phosphatase [Candidatus Nanopelagicales bacterium]
MSVLAAVLFDMDGTLVETESLWHASESITMASFGSEWTEEEQRFALGGPFDAVAEYMASKAGVSVDEVGAKLVSSIDELMRAEPLTVQPGVRALYDEARAAGIPTGLVTNSFRQLVEIVLDSTAMEFDVIVAGDEIEENKPHPLPYLTACELLGVNPQQVVVLEDSMTGIESAHRAGCYVVAIPQLGDIAAMDRQLVVSTVEGLDLARLQDLLAAEDQ